MGVGVLKTYRDLLPVTDATPMITLGEGDTPLVKSNRLAAELGCPELYFKLEGCNPTGSFKDRGMVVAIAKALEEGSRAIMCASTGNTSASAAAAFPDSDSRFPPDLARARGYPVEVEYEDVPRAFPLPADWDQYLALLSKKDKARAAAARKTAAGPGQRRPNGAGRHTNPDAVMENFDTFLALMADEPPDK
ncbi:Threonine synthase [Geodia barretti]|uniref:L-serine ammonia-lyase n=1 Tax=Geodia barretti TaxID=519541 RepID=A0AA35X2K7_GEOBA|nr:Threonine synthase [Geodia barretti]